MITKCISNYDNKIHFCTPYVNIEYYPFNHIKVAALGVFIFYKKNLIRQKYCSLNVSYLRQLSF